MGEAILTRNGLFVPESYFETMVQLRAIKRKFTISYTQLGKFTKKITMVKRKQLDGESYIVLPRFGGLQIIDKFSKKYGLDTIHTENRIEKGERPVVPFKRTGSFRGNQKLIFDHILCNYYNRTTRKKGLSGTIVKLKTGQGKSYLAVGLIEKIQRKTLIICHNSTVADDWAHKTLPAEFPGSTIGEYNGKRKLDGDIVVGIINSLIMDKMSIQVVNEVGRKRYKDVQITPDEFFARFGFIIYDETQRYNSDKFSKIFWKAQAPYVLGLSATPDRHVFSKLSYWGIGEVLETSKLKGYTEKKSSFNGTVRMIKYKAPPEYARLIISEKSETVNVAGTVNMIVSDPYRNNVIAEELEKLIMLGSNIFVFSDRTEHLNDINDVLDIKMEKYVCYDEKIKKVVKKGFTKGVAENILSFMIYYSPSILTGKLNITPVQMKYAEDYSNLLYTTYQYMDTGKSIPKMNAALFATPRRNSSEQAVGRILRMGGREDIMRIIVDIVDWAITLKSQWYNRKDFYKSQKYEIKEIICDAMEIKRKKYISGDFARLIRKVGKVKKEKCLPPEKTRYIASPTDHQEDAGEFNIDTFLESLGDE